MSKITDLIITANSGARKNKYRVLLPTGELASNMDILCHSTSIPGRILTPVDVMIKGKKTQIVGETALDGNWEATFYNTKDMKVRNYFTEWMEEMHTLQMPTDPNNGVFGLEAINSSIASVKKVIADVENGINKVQSFIDDPINSLFGSSDSPDYQRNIVIQQLGSSDLDISYEVTLIGAFPISIDNIDLDDSTAEISTTTVSFVYTDIKIGRVESQSTTSLFLGDEVGSLF